MDATLRKEIAQLKSHDHETNANKKIIYDLAKPIFIDYTIEIIHDDDGSAPIVAIRYVHASNTVYISLNVALWLSALPMLKAILLHELSHVINKDHLTRKIFKLVLNKLAPTLTVDEILDCVCILSKAQELRADLYALINSQDHGAQFIDFFKLLPEDLTRKWHPKPSERIALLKNVQANLYAKAQLGTLA